MKKFLVFLMCLMFFVPSLSGCTVLNPNSNISQVEKQKNIKFFVKTAVRITLYETKPDIDDLAAIQMYLVAAQGFVESGLQDLASLRSLVKQMLPEQYHILTLTIVDVIERYVQAHISNPDENIVKRNQLIKSGLVGAIEAINEYIVQ